MLPLIIFSIFPINKELVVNIDNYIERLAKFALSLYLILVIIQKIKIIGGFLHGNYKIDVSCRPTAIFSHPTELGIFTVLLTTILFFSSKTSFVQKHIFFIISMLINIESQNRTSLVILFGIYFMYFKNFIRFKYGSYNIGIIKVLFIILIILGIFIGLSNLKRFQTFSHFEYFFSSLYELHEYLNMIDTEYINFEKNKIGPKLQKFTDIDISLATRVTKWLIVFNKNFKNIKYFFLGSGIGKFGPAIDGFYVRVFGETGIIGLILVGGIFLILFKIFNSHISFYKVRYVFFVLLLHSITLDAWYFSRVGYFTWLLFGLYISYYSNKKIK